MNGPWTITEAYNALNQASASQLGAENAEREASRDLAQKEKLYRVALTQEMLRLHVQDKVAWTACEVFAKGTDHVAKLRQERDFQRGVVEACRKAAWRATADRKDTQRLAEWSMRRELAEHGQPDQRLAWTPRAA